MINYYDCSINEISQKLHNINSYGPKENDIMYDLGIYANKFGFNRVYDYKLADIIITNTYYTEEILEWSNINKIPRIKRMDGIYWNNNLLYKNELHIKAAKISDHVIFISEYSRKSLKDLYNIYFDNSSVILNNSESHIIKKSYDLSDSFRWVSVCSNWNREDKRLNEIVKLAKVFNNDIFTLIGVCDIDRLPNNIIKVGYIEDRKRIQEIIIQNDAFISLFFRDAGSKVTCQAVQCQIPILYTNSGGLPELVNKNGVIVDDYTNINILEKTPKLNTESLIISANNLKSNYNKFILNYNKRENYIETIREYFNIAIKYVKKCN